MSEEDANTLEPGDDAPSDSFSIQELVDASPATISLIDTHNWEIRFQNCSSRTMFGDVVGKRCHEKLVQSPAPCTFCRAKEALKTGKTTSSEVALPNGRWLLIQWAPIRQGQTFLAVESIIDVTESKGREEEAHRLKDLFEHQATIDPLTELLNRRGWTELAERVWWRAIQNREVVEVMLLDIDHFKEVNDRFGHAAGDQVLRHVAGILRQQTRPGDLLGRWGGEEFILLLHPPVADMQAIGERIREAVYASSMQIEDASAPVHVTVSIGATTFDPNGNEPGGLDIALVGADRNLYRAKKEGRNRVCL